MTDIRTWKIHTYGVGICMYMYVYACICMYIAASTSDRCTTCLPVRICMYMSVYHVYVCICPYIMYLYVYEVYARIVFVYACISCNHTSRHWKRCHVPEALSHGAAIGGPHSVHPWASGHPLFFALGRCCSDPIWRTPPAARV